MNNDSSADKRLILDALLESYRQRRMEIISCQNNYYKTLQLFFSGIFLLIAYIIVSQSYILIVLISFLLIVMNHIIFHNFKVVTNLGSNALQLEYRINHLLNANKNYLIDYEIKWGGITNIEFKSNDDILPSLFSLSIGISFPILIGGYFFYETYGPFPFIFLLLGFFCVMAWEIKYSLDAIERRIKIRNKLIIKKEKG